MLGTRITVCQEYILIYKLKLTNKPIPVVDIVTGLLVGYLPATSSLPVPVLDTGLYGTPPLYWITDYGTGNINSLDIGIVSECWSINKPTNCLH